MKFLNLFAKLLSTSDQPDILEFIIDLLVTLLQQYQPFQQKCQDQKYACFFGYLWVNFKQELNFHFLLSGIT